MTASTTPCEQETGLSLTELMMLPVILLWMTFQVFARHVVTLKQMRRTRPLPKAWQEHYARLRVVEWHIQELTAAGVEQILSGEELDLTDLWMDPDPPEEFGQMPISAWEMHRRFEAIARFHADPERYIRRAARRVLARDGERDPLGRDNPLRDILRALARHLQSQRPPTPPTTAPSAADFCTPAWTRGIRAPP